MCVEVIVCNIRVIRDTVYVVCTEPSCDDASATDDDTMTLLTRHPPLTYALVLVFEIKCLRCL